MRYSVFFKKAGGEKTCVYNTMSPDLALALMNPKVHLAVDSAGTFECALNPNSPAMSEEVLERMATKVMIQEYRDHVPNEYLTDTSAEQAEHDANKEKVIFYGRLLSIDKDFYNTPSLYCEGALSFLNDTVIMPKTLPKRNTEQADIDKYGQYFTPAQALSMLLHEHNLAVSKGGSEQAIKFDCNTDNMVVTMRNDLFSGEKDDGTNEEMDPFSISTYTNTLEVLNNLKKTYGGHFRVHYRPIKPADKTNVDPALAFGDQMAIPVLDWIADFDNTKQGSSLPDSESYIEFGKNLLDLTQKTDGANIVNCLFMTGKKVASAKSKVIGDEIDVAPMCYYWMVRDNGSDPPSLVTSDQNQPVSGTNVHDLRYFMNVKEGAIFRDPVSLDELQAIGEQDLSHVYHVGDHWYAYNPYTSDFIDVKAAKEQGSVTVDNVPYPYDSITDEDFMNCDVIRMGGAVVEGGSSSFVPPSWLASSRGMAWAWGKVINYIGGDAQIRYDWRTDYSCTGLWDSEDGSWDRPPGDLAGSSLQVYGNETYYYKCKGFTDSSIGVSPVLTITSKWTLRKNGCIIMTRSTAASGTGSDIKYSSITIGNPENNEPMYLNLSSMTKNTDKYPSTREQLNMQLWRYREPVFDEYITLYGIADGTPKWYLDNVKVTDSNTGREKTETVLRYPKRVKQLLIGTTDDEQWFCYPTPTGEGVREQFVPDIEDFNWSSVPQVDYNKVYYMDGMTGYVFTYDGLNPISQPLMRAYKVNSYGIEDPVSIRKYGRIEKIVNFSNCQDPDTLRDLGGKTLFEARLEGLEINVTALDLSLLENNVDSPDILDMISIRSSPHKVGEMDTTQEQFSLPLTERDIPLNDPASQQFSIGYTGTRKITKTYDWVRR